MEENDHRPHPFESEHAPFESRRCKCLWYEIIAMIVWGSYKLQAKPASSASKAFQKFEVKESGGPS